MKRSLQKLVYEYGRLRLGQTVLWNQLEFAPTNYSGPIYEYCYIDGCRELINEMFDVNMVGKIIRMQEVSFGCLVTVELKSLATRTMNVDPDGRNRGNFGSLTVLKDSYQLELSI
jgi:hypothetical protein